MPDKSPPTDAEAAPREAEPPEIERLHDLLAAAADRERALVHELQQGVQDMLAVTRSIHWRTRESGGDPDEPPRISPDGLTQSPATSATPTSWERPAWRSRMSRDELHAMRYDAGPDDVINGSAIRLRQKAAELMGLAVHELATNSIEFGALAQNGTPAVRWRLAEAPDGPMPPLDRTETGFSLVTAAPRRSGFGRQFTEEALPCRLGAKTMFTLRPAGFTCSISVPAQSYALRDAVDDAAPASASLRLAE